MKRIYLITRDLHLYFGLFISPLLIVFSISVFLLVHAWHPDSRQTAVRTASNLPVPAGLAALNGREQINALRPILDALGVHGEINFVRRVPTENRLVIPVIVPGRAVSVDLNLTSNSAAVTERSVGIGGGIGNAMIYLHKMPGQHNAAVRGNWFWMKVWSVLTDATVYLVLFLSVSGIYLWAVLRAERCVGLSLLAAGALSFFGLVYAVIR